MRIKSRTDRIADFQAYVDCCGLYRIIDSDVFAKINALGYFDAPASTKYHLAYEGGLYEHSRNVADALMKFTTDNRLCWQRSQSPYIVGFFHDLCKADQYKFNKDLNCWEVNEKTLYKVQIGAFESKENAERLAEKARKQGYSVIIKEEKI